MRKALVRFGNFIFRWRDTIFTLIFIPAYYLITIPELAVGGYEGEIAASLLGFALAFAGQLVRLVTISWGFVKRSGMQKRIHAEGVMKSGLFAHTRNPLYVGNFLIVTGGIVTLNLLPYYIVFLPLFYLIYYSITLAEEEYLKGKFGREYDEYLMSVNRYLPGNISKIGDSFRDLEFTWKRFFKREYSSTVVIFFAILLADILKFRFRHDLAFDSLPSLTMWGAMAVLVTGLVIVRVLTKTGRLEWREEAPKH